MKYYYSLRISVEDDKTKLINEILGIPSNMPNVGWGIEKVEGEEDEPIYFISYFLGILKSNYKKLEDIGVERHNITIWMLYEYDQQCNMEFFPDDLLELGKEGIKLCISCWEQ